MATPKKVQSKKAGARKSGSAGKKAVAASPTKKKAGSAALKARSKPKPTAKAKGNPKSKPGATVKPVAKAKPATKQAGSARSGSVAPRRKPVPKAAKSAQRPKSARTSSSAQVGRNPASAAAARAGAFGTISDVGPEPTAARELRGEGPAGRISSRELAIELARLANDDKCSDIVVLDVRKLSPISDFVVVASGTSDRQMRAVADHAEDLGAQLGHKAFRSSKDPRALWLLIDFSDVVIHIFEPNTRAHYDIEMMWGDAKRIPWNRAAAASTKPASRSRKALAPS